MLQLLAQFGENHPSKLLGDKEAADLAEYNYVSGVMLEVQCYREAQAKFGEDADTQEQQWRTLENMLPMLPACIRPCSSAKWCSTTNHPSLLV